MKRICFALFLLQPALAVLSQPVKVTLSGIIKDAGTKAILTFVNITLQSAKDSRRQPNGLPST